MPHEQGMSSKCTSQRCADSVPVPCTHRPSLDPIGCFGEFFGLLGIRGCLGIFLFWEGSCASLRN